MARGYFSVAEADAEPLGSVADGAERDGVKSPDKLHIMQPNQLSQSPCLYILLALGLQSYIAYWSNMGD